jgi:hypothetical protein
MNPDSLTMNPDSTAMNPDSAPMNPDSLTMNPDSTPVNHDSTTTDRNSPSGVEPHSGGINMAAGYIPRNDAEFLAWMKNFFRVAYRGTRERDEGTLSPEETVSVGG